ncbi:sensor histidine kinase [Paenibacillus sinopodophylli]|uniref:sensor histidine kinase n=1 Tax=Paenibacillus sinopodophylli TaxID=1837342 RepID=UPI00110CBC58|nr:sensor histidine kinase [Paenibacillus sinopodophylli]
MIIALVITLLIASVVLWLNPRDASFRWLSIALFAASSSVMIYLVGTAYPEVRYDVWINSLYAASDAAIAYTFGMFGVVYSGLLHKRQQRMYGILLFIAAVIVLVMTPLSPSRLINYAGRNELPMLVLICSSLGFSAIQLVVSNTYEKHPFKRSERLLTNLLALPALLYLIASYVFYMQGIDLFQYNHWFGTGFLMLFILIGLTRGILGVRFKVEMMKVDASLHVLKGGSNLLNHTIKNEIGKIDILLHQIERELQGEAQLSDSSRETAGMITAATESVQHVQTMMGKFNEFIQAIKVNMQKDNPLHVIESSLKGFESVCPPELVLLRTLEPVQEVYFDSVHLKEVMTNLLNNAAEAMSQQGQITVQLAETTREVIISIHDMGKGIAKAELPYIFDPFYSTKKMTTHYGLGLYYCKNVMMKHDGSIRVESEPGLGTSFYLYLRK